jgi:hypothetical protein
MISFIKIKRQLMPSPQLVIRIDEVYYLLQRSILDLQNREILNVHLHYLVLVLCTQMKFATQNGVDVLLVQGDQCLLVEQVGLLDLMVGVPAPVNGLLVDRNIHQVLVELHDQNLIVLGMLIKVMTNFT